MGRAWESHAEIDQIRAGGSSRLVIRLANAGRYGGSIWFLGTGSLGFLGSLIGLGCGLFQLLGLFYAKVRKRQGWIYGLRP
jgi:hypothetical protein